MTIVTPPRKRASPRRYSYGPEVCDWIESHCVLPSGDHAGETFRLMGWQRDWIEDLYTTDARGKLRYRWALLGVPKGNGKSPLVAALALYHLLGDPDEPDPWVVVSAASDKQADIVFDACKRMCEMSPRLRDATIRFRWEIRPKAGLGKLERVAAAKGKLDGKLVSFLVVDELHEWNLENWVVLTGGALKRKRGQIIQITTAGYDQESICYREYAKGRQIESGEIRNPSYLFRWYEAPKAADYRDPAVWRACNPSYGVLVHEPVLKDLLINMPESQFRRYRLNQWTETAETWLGAGEWEACGVGSFEIEDGEPTVVGWDASTKHDSTGIVRVQPRRCAAGKLHFRVKARAWERPLQPDGTPVAEWRLPIAECVADIREAFARFDVTAIAFDPAYISWEADELEATGLPMVEWPQTPARMIPATQALYEAICSPCECGGRRLEHDGDPSLARHMANVQTRAMRGGGQMLEKKARGRKIDLAVALLMAVGMMANEESERGVPQFFAFGGEG